MIAIDCETTGLDLLHSCRPFFVTTCGDAPGDTAVFYEWDVDPLTRMVRPDPSDLRKIQTLVDLAANWGKDTPLDMQERHTLVLHNAKFDVKALERVGVWDWPWSMTRDTVIAAHLLNSAQEKNLTALATNYLRIDIKGREDALEKAVKQARDYCRRYLKDWKIANGEHPGMPSDTSGEWRSDYWLPRALVKYWWGTLQDTEEGYQYRPPGYAEEGDEGHPWWTVLSDYATADSEMTMACWQVMSAELRRKGLYPIFLERMKLVQIVHDMEVRGATFLGAEMDKAEEGFREKYQETEDLCVSLAASDGYELSLPKGSATNKSLTSYIYDHLKLPVVKRTEKGSPSLDADTFDIWMDTLKPNSKERAFVGSLMKKRKLGKTLTDVATYKRFRLSTSSPGVYTLHPDTNPTGGATLRYSFKNPNTANVCMDGSTEYLTEKGWVRADSLEKGVKVAQFWKSNQSIDFVIPVIHVNHFKGDMHHITTEEQIDMMLTPEHRCLFRNRKTGEWFDNRAESFLGDAYHYHAGEYVGGTEHYSPAMVAWLCAVQADGSYQYRDGRPQGIQFSFKKSRKIQRLRWALTTLGAKFTERKYGDVSYFRLAEREVLVQTAKRNMPDKRFGPWILDCNRETLNFLVEEIFLWDGAVSGRGFSSSVKQNTDWVQILMTLSGTRSHIRSYMPGTEWSVSEHHYLNVAKYGRDRSLTTDFRRELIKWDGPVYCLTVSSSYIITRRNGRVSITGNCKPDSDDGPDDFSMRHAFGPAPKRVWVSADYENLELRIPGYESGEKPMIDLFEKPDEAPFFGSYHLLNASIIQPDLFWPLADKKGAFKDKYGGSWYQWIKNAGFALIYGCQEMKFDRTARRPGGYRLLRTKLPNLFKLSDYWIEYANENGYVETIPDRTLDSKRGYPIVCTRLERGQISPTVPLNYHVQSTAMWCTSKAMVRCTEQLQEWSKDEEREYWIALQIHDELVFDMPDQHENELARKVSILRALMEESGDDIGIPLKVSAKLHRKNWGEGVSVKRVV